MRIAFMGTPDFAVPSLDMLVTRGDEIMVFTQPDRPRGRGHGVSMCAVKTYAVEKGLDVCQFERISSEDGIATLKAFAPSLMVTAAFGQILSAKVLDIPQYGCINVHASILPYYRGAAPIQWAIINGETITGVTTMMTDVGLDTGDILLCRKTEIGKDETAGELFERLSVMGAGVLMETIESVESGTLVRTPQDNSVATKCGMIRKEMAKIDFFRSADEVHNVIRGMNPSPVAFTTFDGGILKVYRSKVASDCLGMFEKALPGECVVADPKNGLFVKCGYGAIELTEVQFAGTKRMTSKAALNSRNMLGRILGT